MAHRVSWGNDNNDDNDDKRDFFKRIWDTKGTFPAKMGTIKDRNSKDLTEAEEIKKSWWEYTEDLYRKSLNHWNNHDGAVTYLEPDCLECEVKWALGNITTNKASGGGGIPAEILKILKENVVKLSLENSEMAAGLEKVSVHCNPEERHCQRMLKLLYNCNHFTIDHFTIDARKLASGKDTMRKMEE